MIEGNGRNHHFTMNAGNETHEKRDNTSTPKNVFLYFP